jgi:hypothetical protein
MAAPIAYEQPTVNRAWEALLAHVPTLVLIWVGTAVVGFLGWIVQLVFSLMGYAVSSGDVFVTNIFGLASLAPFLVITALLNVMFSAVPVLYYESGEVVTTRTAFAELMRRPFRYFMAGVLYFVAAILGALLCVLPGIAVAYIGPVYVNLIFATDRPILDVFASSFQAVYRSPNGWTFVGIQFLSGLVATVVTVCTCGLASLVVVPILAFYIQNVAYNKGVIS